MASNPSQALQPGATAPHFAMKATPDQVVTLEDFAGHALIMAFYPEAELLGWDWHDWNGDPDSRGTWATAPAGRAELLDPARGAPSGRLAFATSDLAPEHQGWVEGALGAGAAAAAHVRSLVAASR